MNELLGELDASGVRAAVQDRIRRATVPLYVMPEGMRPPSLRSAMLLRVANTHFLLTAAHRINDNSSLLFSQRGDGEDTIDPVQLQGVEVLNWPKHDIALIRLTDAIASELVGSTRQPVTIDEIDRERNWSGQTVFMLCGYPGREQPPNVYQDKSVLVTPRPFTFLTAGYKGEKGDSQHNEDECVAVHWTREMHWFEKDGQPIGLDTETPSPEGMSGCGMWRIRFTVNGYQCALTAMQTRSSSVYRFSVGPLVTHAIFILGKEYPEFRDVIRSAFAAA
ncbi:MAG: hypothetical protein U0836_25490 [Pirellulales bacterium]